MYALAYIHVYGIIKNQFINILIFSRHPFYSIRSNFGLFLALVIQKKKNLFVLNLVCKMISQEKQFSKWDVFLKVTWSSDACNSIREGVVYIIHMKFLRNFFLRQCFRFRRALLIHFLRSKDY